MRVNVQASPRVQGPMPALRSVTRGSAAWAAAIWLVFVPAGASAQELPSTPLTWQAPLPMPPPSTVLPASGLRAQRAFLKGRFLVGANLTHGLTPDQDVGSRWSLSPFFRNTPGRVGWGPSFGLNWFSGDLTVAIDGVRTTVGTVKVRPVMAGVGYTFGGSRARTTLSLVGGYAFTDATVTAALPPGTTATITIDDAWVVRPNIGMTVALTRRLALVGSIGYIYTNPTVTVSVTRPGRAASQVGGTYRSDYVNITVGTAVSIF